MAKVDLDGPNGKLTQIHRAIMNMQASTGIKPVTLELFISPRPVEELEQLNQEWLACLRPYGAAINAWEKSNHKRAGENPLDYWRRRDEKLKPKFEKQLARIHEIDRMTVGEKAKIVSDLAGRLKKTMVQLRGATLIYMGYENYECATELLQNNPIPSMPELEFVLAAYKIGLDDLVQQHNATFGDEQTYKALEELTDALGKSLYINS